MAQAHDVLTRQRDLHELRNLDVSMRNRTYATQAPRQVKVISSFFVSAKHVGIARMHVACMGQVGTANAIDKLYRTELQTP